jgi:hypothetical protein
VGENPGQVRLETAAAEPGRIVLEQLAQLQWTQNDVPRGRSATRSGSLWQPNDRRRRFRSSESPSALIWARLPRAASGAMDGGEFFQGSVAAGE